MADLIAKLEVLSKESGCLLDLSAILDVAVCPTINLKTNKKHKVEEKEDYICVTPTEKKKKPVEKPQKKKRCTKDCFQVHEKVCKKNQVALDLQILVVLGLLTQDELVLYLRLIGELGEHDDLPFDRKRGDVKIDPLLSLDVGDNGSIVSLDLLGEDSLLDLSVGDNTRLKIGGDGPLLDLDILSDLRRRSANGGLVDVQVGGEADKHEAAIDVDILTHKHKKGGYKNGGYKDHKCNKPSCHKDTYNKPHAEHYSDRALVDAQVGGKKDHKKAVIDADILTHERRSNGLLDLQVGGEADEDKAAIDIDILTHKKKHYGKKNGPSKNYYLSHYQPRCSKGFKKEHRDRAEKCHARDVNHCLAICHSRSALLSIKADVKIGNVADVRICAAVEFNHSAGADNCRYFVSRESEARYGGSDELVADVDAFALVRL